VSTGISYKKTEAPRLQRHGAPAWLGVTVAQVVFVGAFFAIITYVGVILVTVVAVGFFQWGMGTEFFYLCAVYLIILFFGGVWGLRGVFFAIPAATLIKAIVNAWPTAEPENVKHPPNLLWSN
jgi:putative permease